MSGRDDAGVWARLRSAFDDVVARDDADRAARLEEISAADSRLREQLDVLLAADASAGERLARIDRLFGAAAPRSPDPLGMVGRSIGHFRVIAPLASGGMGVVYRAEDTRLRRSVALKFPLPALHVERAARDRFLREAQSAAALDHPNICSIYEAGETEDGQLFLAMPLYDGETLRTRLARIGAFDPAEAMAIARQIALGVRAAHDAGIVHRDLKPANVMLLPDGTVKLLDFGLAKMHDLTLTATGTLVGTVAYMAPEQIRGQRVDARADLWAIGVILYEMLTGRRPFEGENDVAVVYSVLESDPVPPSSLNPAIDAAGDRLVAALLRKNASERPASASQLAHDFGALDSAPSRAPTPPLTERRTSRFSRRAAAIAVTAAAVVLAGVVAAWEAFDIDNTLQTAVGEAESATPRLVVVLPIRNVSGDTAHDYLALGLTTSVGWHLSWLNAATVPRHHVIRRYGDANVPPREVAAELKAAAVVYATLDTIGDRVVLDFEVVDSSAAGRRWSRRYERPADELHELQPELLADLVAALRVRITDEERTRLTRQPTTSAAAYDLYLRGRAAYAAREPGDRARPAQAFFARARALDPGFALARAMLVDTYYAIGITGLSQTHMEQARVEAEAALRIDPALSEAHQALGWYWSTAGKEPDRAIAEFRLAVNGAPHDVFHRTRLADAYRDRAMWAEAITEYEHAMGVERITGAPAASAAVTYSRLRRYEEAVAAWDRVLQLDPGNQQARLIRGHVFVRWQGTADTLAAAVRIIGGEFNGSGNVTWARVQVARVQRRWQDVLTAVDESPVQRYSSLEYRPWPLVRGEAYRALGDAARSRADYEKARAVLEDSVRAQPDDARFRIALGLAYAGLGRRAEATAEARRALELTNLATENTAAAATLAGAVEVFALAGEADAAFEQLDVLFTMAAGREVAVPLLRVDPTYDPLRVDPRFERLLRRYSQ
jgi:eukaryotic-like serine/threonine-protein kinase